MKYWLCIISFLLVLAALPAPSAAQSVSQATLDKLLQTKTSLDALTQTKANVLAKELIDDARRSITKAQEGIDMKKEKVALQALELAQIQMDYARVKTEERGAAEKTAVTREKLNMLQKKLDEILTGKVETK